MGIPRPGGDFDFEKERFINFVPTMLFSAQIDFFFKLHNLSFNLAVEFILFSQGLLGQPTVV
jgi:hypothetical protein